VGAPVQSAIIMQYQPVLCRLQLWNRKVDTKCLMAWNDSLVVLSFRGTASMRNVLADIKVPVNYLHAGSVNSGS
jgi:hypothetical protein